MMANGTDLILTRTSKKGSKIRISSRTNKNCRPWCIRLQNFRLGIVSENERRAVCDPDFEGYEDPYQVGHISSVKDSVKGEQNHFADALAGLGAFKHALDGSWKKRDIEEVSEDTEMEV